MERLNVHVALEVCEIVIENATIAAFLESGSKMASSRRRQSDFHHEGHEELDLPA
jgi:hypothetical protein